MTKNSKNPASEVNDEVRLEYIKIQWADIRHSRLQEWSALGIIAGVMYAFAQLDPSETVPRILLSSLGFICALIGASMTWQHYWIFRTKIRVISKQEIGIGIDKYPGEKRSKAIIPVQLLMFILFGGIASVLAGIALHEIQNSLSNNVQAPRLPLWIGIIAFAFFFMMTLPPVRNYLDPNLESNPDNQEEKNQNDLNDGKQDKI